MLIADEMIRIFALPCDADSVSSKIQLSSSESEDTGVMPILAGRRARRGGGALIQYCTQR
jgi:hypothetical protein